MYALLSVSGEMDNLKTFAAHFKTCYCFHTVKSDQLTKRKKKKKKTVGLSNKRKCLIEKNKLCKLDKSTQLFFFQLRMKFNFKPI